ncbi:hypothetical protein [Nonomuraea fuscirosea]|uniref:hypothetical protein n=1 Tax=Nonomuraea fuscirosea TaxID=1291556 RepID=UPI003449261A
MTNDLIDVRTRLVSPSRLHQVAALLNMPYLDETTTHEDDAPPTQQALYTRIADWTQLSAQTAGLPGASDGHQITERFAYLIEYTDQHAKGWHQPPGEYTDGVVQAETAETVAQSVLPRYITHLAEHRDEYHLWLTATFTLRASVWHIDDAERERRGRRAGWASAASTYNQVGIPPHAIEVRTPSQIRHVIDDVIEGW